MSTTIIHQHTNYLETIKTTIKTRTHYLKIKSTQSKQFWIIELSWAEKPSDNTCGQLLSWLIIDSGRADADALLATYFDVHCCSVSQLHVHGRELSYQWPQQRQLHRFRTSHWSV